MHRFTSFVAVTIVAITFSSQLALAGPLTEASITKIINRVSLIDPHSGDRPAVVRDIVKDDLGVETGAQSRSELLFQDDTLTRLGAETFFSFKTGTRDMTLEKGAMLLQVPKGLGGAKIHTAAVTAAITGTTIMMEYLPKQYIKVLVLEGSLRLSRNGLFGDSVVLKPGKMVIMRPDAKKIPDPVDVDLQHVVQTSSLVNFPNSEPLPSTSLIQSAIEQQQTQLANSKLVPTNLVIGNGTNVIVATNDQLAKLTGTTSGLLGATLSSPTTTLKNGVLPIVNSIGTTLGTTTGSVSGTVDTLLTSTTGTVTNTAGAVTGTVSSLVDSTTGTIATTASDLLNSAASTVTSIPVSSTSQVSSLLDTAVATTSGIATVTPAITNTLNTAASTVSTATSTTASLLNSATSTTTGAATSTTTASPSIGSTSTTTTASSSPTLTTSLLTGVTSATGTLVGTTTGTTTHVLGLGH